MIAKQRSEKENCIDVSNSSENLSGKQQKTKNFQSKTSTDYTLTTMIAQASMFTKPSVNIVKTLSSRNLNVEAPKIEKPTKQADQKIEPQIPSLQRLTKYESKLVDQNDDDKPTIHDKYSKELETGRLLKYYSQDQLDYFRESIPPQSFLQRHSISSSLRAKMVDWMVEVLCSYRCKDQTFFLAISIMDQFCDSTKKILGPHDLHLIGVACMFIASKYEEIYPIKLSVVYEKIGHRKLSKDEIKAKEADIVTSINFNFAKVTLYEIMTHLLTKISMLFKLPVKCVEYIMKTSIYLSKMVYYLIIILLKCVYDYELISQIQNGQVLSILAGSILIVSLKIVEQTDLMQDSEVITSSISNILQLDNTKLIEYSNKVLKIAKGFESLYPNLENLKKFSSFTFPIQKESNQ